MDYDARKDSLQSEQDSEKVEIYFSVKGYNGGQALLEVYIQETNKPKMKLLKTRPAVAYNGHYDFPESLIIDYYFEGNSSLTQFDKKL